MAALALLHERFESGSAAQCILPPAREQKQPRPQVALGNRPPSRPPRRSVRAGGAARGTFRVEEEGIAAPPLTVPPFSTPPPSTPPPSTPPLPLSTPRPSTPPLGTPPLAHHHLAHHHLPHNLLPRHHSLRYLRSWRLKAARSRFGSPGSARAPQTSTPSALRMGGSPKPPCGVSCA